MSNGATVFWKSEETISGCSLFSGSRVYSCVLNGARLRGYLHQTTVEKNRYLQTDPTSIFEDYRACTSMAWSASEGSVRGSDHVKHIDRKSILFLMLSRGTGGKDSQLRKLETETINSSDNVADIMIEP
jgi:hypothetical protein